MVFGGALVVVVVSGIEVASAMAAGDGDGVVVAATGAPATPVRLLSATAPVTPVTATSNATTAATVHRLDNTNP